MSRLNVASDLNEGLRRCLKTNPNVYIWGEDILDPYGGAFKVTAGLSTEFPGRVITTPISEAAIVGLGVGAAMRGLYPVVEIMFGDFIALAADQLINHAAKFAGMYNGQIRVPLVVRTPMGGGRGYGPTHSQTLEKHFLGVPGLRVISPSHFLSPGQLLENAILRDSMPVLFIEHKLLYPLPVKSDGTESLHVDTLIEQGRIYPTVRVRNFTDADSTPDVTLVSYGGLSRLLEKALEQLVQEEVWVEAFLPTELNRTKFPVIEKSCRQTRRLLLVEEGTAGFGWTAEIAKTIAEALCGSMTLHISSLQAANSVVPSGRNMEDEMLPSVGKIIENVLEVISK